MLCSVENRLKRSNSNINCSVILSSKREVSEIFESLRPSGRRRCMPVTKDKADPWRRKKLINRSSKWIRREQSVCALTASKDRSSAWTSQEMTWEWLPRVLRMCQNLRGPCSKIQCLKVHRRSNIKLHSVLPFFEIIRIPKHRATLKISHRCFCKAGWRCKRAIISREKKATRRAGRHFSAYMLETREESRF